MNNKRKVEIFLIIIKNSFKPKKLHFLVWVFLAIQKFRFLYQVTSISSFNPDYFLKYPNSTTPDSFSNFETKFNSLKTNDDLSLAGLVGGTMTLPTLLNPSNFEQELNSHTMPAMYKKSFFQSHF